MSWEVVRINAVLGITWATLKLAQGQRVFRARFIIKTGFCQDSWASRISRGGLSDVAQKLAHVSESYRLEPN